MPSNAMYVCLDCRVGGKGIYPNCLRDNHRTLCFGAKISVPKKSNTRAWKRIERGEYRWDRRKSRGRRGPDTVTRYEYEEVPVEHTDYDCDHMCCNLFKRSHTRRVRIPGSGTKYENPRRKPDVDLGG